MYFQQILRIAFCCIQLHDRACLICININLIIYYVTIEFIKIYNALFGYMRLEVDAKCDFEACNAKYLTGFIIGITMIKYSFLFFKFVVRGV
jgi:hypothetical protein